MIWIITATYVLATFGVVYRLGMTALTAWERGKALVDTQ